jgi:hypothetical protein
MKTIDTIKTPTLHAAWEAAKKATKAAAKDAGEEAAYTALTSEFKRDFGPSLDKWHLGFPDAAKLAKAVLALQETITAYSRAISKSGLGPDRRKILTRQLESASAKVEEHYRLACKAMTGADDAAKQIAEAARKARINADVQSTSLRSAIKHALLALKLVPIDVKVVEWECSRVETLLNGAVKTALAQAREAHLKAQKWLHEHKEELAANPVYKKTATDTAALLLELRDTAEVYDDGFKVVAAMKKAVADSKASAKTPARV